MMLHGANAVGYTNYPDNIVHKFYKQASKSGMDVFRVFNYLNYTYNLNLGVDAASSASGFLEGTLYYTGDVSYHNKGKYYIEYYINLTRDIDVMGLTILPSRIWCA